MDAKQQSKMENQKQQEAKVQDQDGKPTPEQVFNAIKLLSNNCLPVRNIDAYNELSALCIEIGKFAMSAEECGVSLDGDAYGGYLTLVNIVETLREAVTTEYFELLKANEK